jgi:hypothetical protein
MDFDEEKIDEFTLALLYLVSHDKEDGFGARAWKGFDWDTLNRLHEKGFLANPSGKAKSVAMSEEGFRKSKELFEKHFTKKSSVLPFPQFTPDAKRRWEQVPELAKKQLLDAVWCSHCRMGTPLQLRDAKMVQRSLMLQGTCKKCGAEATRMVEPAED